MDYLLLIEQIELEDEYRSMLLTEGVVSSVISAIKRGIAFIKEKICNLIRKIIGIFRKDKRSGGGSSSGSSSTSNKNTVKVSTKVTNNTPKSTTSTTPSNSTPSRPNKPIVTDKDIKNDDVGVGVKVVDNTTSEPVKPTIKRRMIYSYKMFTDFLNCVINFVNSGVSEEMSNFSSELDEYTYTVDSIVNTIEQIAAVKNDQFNERIHDINTMAFDQNIINDTNNTIQTMNRVQQTVKDINGLMMNIGPNITVYPDEINEVNNRIATEVGIDPDTIRKHPNLLYTQIMNKFTVYNLTDNIYNEIIKYNKYAQESCTKVQQGLAILEYKVTNNDTMLARQALDYLKISVDLCKNLGIMMISVANTVLAFKSKSINIAITNFR